MYKKSVLIYCTDKFCTKHKRSMYWVEWCQTGVDTEHMVDTWWAVSAGPGWAVMNGGPWAPVAPRGPGVHGPPRVHGPHQTNNLPLVLSSIDNNPKSNKIQEQTCWSSISLQKVCLLLSVCVSVWLFLFVVILPTINNDSMYVRVGWYWVLEEPFKLFLSYSFYYCIILLRWD